MMITKKAIPRRTVLRGLGVTIALPLLDSMVPAATALAQTADPKMTKAERAELIELFSRIYGFSDPSEPGSEL